MPPALSYSGYRFPPEILSRAVWLYHRFCLSFQDVDDLPISIAPSRRHWQVDEPGYIGAMRS